jgi:hypothetical protein
MKPNLFHKERGVTGFRKTFTPEERAEIERLRLAMRSRLICRYADHHQCVCAIRGIPCVNPGGAE